MAEEVIYFIFLLAGGYFSLFYLYIFKNVYIEKILCFVELALCLLLLQTYCCRGFPVL